ncbi:MAG: protein kinase domain-containing protein [Acidobacteriota bacterium]
MELDGLTGRTIGHYSVLERLGEGGMGVVYKARDVRLGRVAALKVMRPDPQGDDAQKRRFLREAQTASALNHPGIVTVYEIDADAGLEYIAMEFLSGGSLANLIAAGPLPPERALGLMRQVAEALAAAHAAGIVHRDLKPSNIMLASGDRVKIVDFGLARAAGMSPAEPTADPITRTGTVLGTPPYMSPEQISGRAVDARSDIFSLGTIFYELLAGRRPFGEDSGTLTLVAILYEAPSPLAGVSPAIAQLLDRCLQKDPGERFSSAADLKEAIDDALRGEGRLQLPGPDAVPTAGPEPGVSPGASRGGRPSRLGIVAALAAALAAVTAVVVWLSSRTAPPRGEAGATIRASTAAPAEETSIAVLPFVNISADPEQEYFSDGLSEELLDALSRIPQLRVISRTSSFQFKGKNEDIRVIAKKLNVSHVLEGSVRKSGKRIRITAQLVKGADGSHLWSQSYDRSLDDIFELQEDIARAVANASKVTLLGRDRQPEMSRDENVHAYNLYLQGKYFADRQSRENLDKAVSYYQQALQLDPGYARAWAGLARVYVTQTDRGYDPLQKTLQEGRRAIERALELDPNLAEAHAVLGWIRTNYDWDWAGAEAIFQRALDLEPRNGTVVRMACALAATLGQFEKAIELGRRATDLDPLSAGSHVNLASFAYYAGRLDEAEAAVRKGLELNPDYPNAHLQLGMVLLAKSKPGAALAEMEREKEPIWRRLGLALAYHALGRKKEADAALGEFLENHAEGGAYQIAETYAFRGEIDKAFQWLERAYAQRDGGLAATKGDPLLKSLEADPRYAAFLKKMRLPA